MMEKMEQQKKYTKYEKARIIGARATQIAMGAPYLLKLDEEGLKQLKYSPLEMAKREFEEGIIPLKVKRLEAKGGE